MQRREESQAKVPESKDQLDAFEEANLRLNDGLTSCRAVVKDYRALILGSRIPTNASDQVELKDGRPQNLRE